MIIVDQSGNVRANPVYDVVPRSRCGPRRSRLGSGSLPKRGNVEESDGGAGDAMLRLLRGGGDAAAAADEG